MDQILSHLWQGEGAVGLEGQMACNTATTQQSHSRVLFKKGAGDEQAYLITNMSSITTHSIICLLGIFQNQPINKLVFKNYKYNTVVEK